MSPKADTKKVTKKSSAGFSAEEKAAMKERARELKAEAKSNKKKADGEKALFEKIFEMEQPDRKMAERLNEIITTSVPTVLPKTWYGMPAWAKDDQVICFFQSGLKFKTRYSTLGFSDLAKLDKGAMWPTAFALIELSEAVEKKIITLVKKAAK